MIKHFEQPPKVRSFRPETRPSKAVNLNPCSDPNCGRTDGKHTIRCQARYKIKIHIGDWDTGSAVTNKARKIAHRFRTVSKSNQQRSVNPAKQYERAVLTIPEKRLRRAMLRQQNGIWHSNTGSKA